MAEVWSYGEIKRSSSIEIASEDNPKKNSKEMLKKYKSWNIHDIPMNKTSDLSEFWLKLCKTL